MPSEQSYQNTFTSGDPEYLLQLALSSALGEPLQTLMDKDASSWAESAQPETTVTAQNETMEATVEATGTKRMPNSPDAEDTTKSKTRRRKGDPEPDYSSMTREVLKTNQRTGQACDRCKLRKLRCDPTPNSCQPCVAAEQPCRTTDRVTGETFRRGEAGTLKAENEQLKARVSALEDYVKQLQAENEQLSTQLAFYQLLFQVPNDTLH